MNRIIIIGNGFDLAHGLKTSYGDFLNWVKSKKIENPDEYLEYIYSPVWDIYLGTNTPKVSVFLKRRHIEPGNLYEFISNNKEYKLVYKNKFLEHLINAQNLENWADVEEEYFNELKILFHNYQNYEKSKSIVSLTKLNQDFTQIKDYLEEYLCGENEKIITVKENLKNSIIKPFDLNDNISTMPAELDKILFLNFNYTSYEQHYARSRTQIIHIHGELKNEKNPIIFGYGNEDNEIYKEIKKINCNEFLTNIKSFKYSNVSKYKDLMTFMKSALYQIYIWGHSCGSSDGTLLKELFEDNNCVSIRPFYRVFKNGSDNHSDIVTNLSRHFSNDMAFRCKIMNKELCEELK
jgi:hypothetical protein